MEYVFGTYVIAAGRFLIIYLLDSDLHTLSIYDSPTGYDLT